VNSAGTPEPGSFDRIPPAKRSKPRSDPQGKQALFSSAEQPPSLGSAAIDCPRCHQRSVVSLLRLAQLSLPGVVTPVPGRGYRAWLKCPECAGRGWVKVTVGR